jgi:hypothetical protein
MTKKVIHGILAALFVVFTYVQFNDPDPERWVTLYGMVAGLSLLHGFWKPLPYVTVALMGLCLIWALTLIPGMLEWFSSDDKSEMLGHMMDDKPYIEQTRELGGLLIASAALFYLWWSSRAKKEEQA